MKIFLFVACLFYTTCMFSQPCTTIDGTGCACENGTSDCDLLPDLTISWYALETFDFGPTEYSQSGNGSNNGRLRITGSTPNIGFGSFTVRGTDYYICGTDTIYDPTGNLTCPGGSDPTNLLNQRIYHRDSAGTITYTDIWAGAQTYHPTHGHNHVDDWVTFTLRIADANEPDTLLWPIVGDGAKIGFCLMDFGSCNTYNGHCRDNQSYNSGTILTSTSFPNYGFGGGSYSCSPVEQGISVGFTDIYSKNLDGMWIDIPPGTCNGDYWIVAKVDPRNNFLESNENNNWTAIPFTLILQDDSGSTAISASGSSTICKGTELQLSVSAANSYLWSTGDTTQTIMVDSAGYFTVSIDGVCGIATSDTFEVFSINTLVPVTTDDSNCGPDTLNLSASATGGVYWYDDINSDSVIFSGYNFTTPILNQTKTYYVASENIILNASVKSTPYNNSIGGGGNYTGTQWLIFNVNEDIVLQSVKVYASGAGNRTLEILNGFGSQVHIGTFNLPDGESRIILNWSLQIGTNYTFRIVGAPNLFRNNNGVNYPYSDPNNLVSIHNSSAGSAFYYFFYDWEVKAPDFYCLSDKVAVNAVINSVPSISSSLVNDATCGQTNGSIDIEINSGTNPYTYQWNNGNTSQDLSGLGPGIYSVLVTDINLCTSVTSLMVNELADVIATTSKKNVSCAIGNDGNASVVVTGGSPPYTYQWNTQPVQTTNSINNLGGGFYTVIITDTNACTKAVTIEVRIPTDVTTFTIPTHPTTGNSNGEINLLVSGGIAPYTYLWSTGSTLEDLIGVSAGVYYCTVIDRNGCAKLIVSTLVNAPMIFNGQTATKNHSFFDNAVKVYPNPTEKLVNIEFENGDLNSCNIRLYDILGQLLLESKQNFAHTPLTNLDLDLSSFDSGIYNLSIKSKNINLNYKIIKK